MFVYFDIYQLYQRPNQLLKVKG